MLDKIYRLLILVTIFFIISGLSSADAVVENVSIKPENPTKLSEITITSTIEGINTSDNVTLYIKECDENTGLCDQPFSVKLTKIDSNNFSAEVSLQFVMATYFDYWFVVEREGNTTEIKNDSYNVQLTSNSNVDTQNQGNGNDKGIPGFEITALLTAVFIGMLFFMKKR